MRVELIKVNWIERLVGLVMTFLIVAGLFSPVWWAAIAFCLSLGIGVWLHALSDRTVKQPVSLWIILQTTLVFPCLLFGIRFIK